MVRGGSVPSGLDGERRRRKCGHKVRSGCSTCKTRRIKCGEERPSCQRYVRTRFPLFEKISRVPLSNGIVVVNTVKDLSRCITSGWTCDGYKEAPASMRMKPQLIAAKTSQTELLLGAQLANKGLSIPKTFSNCTVRCIAGFFQHDPFWERYVLQLSQSEPAISLALSAINVACSKIAQASDRSAYLNNISIMQPYNDAMKALVKDSASPNRGIYVDLASCILFVCLEFLRGDMNSAWTHINGGRKIIGLMCDGQQVNEASTDTNFSTLTRQTSSEKELMLELSTMFGRLKMQALLFEPIHHSKPRPTLLFPERPSDGSLEFANFAEAKNRSHELSSEAVDFIISVSHLKQQPEAVIFDNLINQIRLENAFKEWLRAFNHLSAQNLSRWTFEESRATKIILAETICMQIWTSTCMCPNEMAFDQYDSEFEELIQLVMDVIGPGGGDLARSIGNFQFDMGIIPVLHFLGKKCRRPLMRRKVLRILGSAHWREGLFDSYRSYRLTFLLMRLEEVGIQPHLEVGTPEYENFVNWLPPEDLRIHVAELGPIPLHADAQDLTLITKPNGVLNPAQVWRTFLPTSGPLPELEAWYTWSP